MAQFQGFRSLTLVLDTIRFHFRTAKGFVLGFKDMVNCMNSGENHFMSRMISPLPTSTDYFIKLNN